MYQAFPYHWTVTPPEEELSEFLKHTASVGLRYSTPLDAPQGQVSYHVVYEKRGMAFADLPKKVRHDVRNGLDYARIEPVSFERLAGDGWRLRAETLERQGRAGAETQAGWAKLCRSAAGLPGFETWAAIHQEELVAAILVFIMDDCASILYQQSATAHLKHGINNTLAYVFTNEALDRPGIQRIFYGLHSLDAPASVDEFKFRMGYTARPVRQRVVFNPLLAPLFNPLAYRAARYLLGKRPGSPTLAKVEGMLRFYLQGRLPLADQSWPENLLDQKDRLLALPEAREPRPA